MSVTLLEVLMVLLLAPPVDDATRRQFLAGGAALLTLAACGRGEEAEPAPRTPTEQIDFSYLDIRATVPSQPQRVVVIDGRGDLEFALSVGYPVVAALVGSSNEVPDHLAAAAPPGLEVRPLNDGGVNFEELAALRPDLIIQRANLHRGDEYSNATLAGIAPVLPVECNRNSWREDLVRQAELLGRRVEVDELVAGYDQATAEVLADIGDVAGAGRVAMVAAGSRATLLWTNTLATSVAVDLGMDVAFNDPADERGSYELSAETIPRLAEADLLFVQAGGEEAVGQLAALPTWQALPAVQADRVVLLDPALNNGFALTATALVRVFGGALRTLRSG